MSGVITEETGAKRKPAPHPERRAGQRWRLKACGAWREVTLLRRADDGFGWRTDDQERSIGDYVWTGPLFTMTLLSDAPATPAPEAVKAMHCDDCAAPMEFIGKGLYRCVSKHCNPAKAAPVVKCHFAPPPGEEHGGPILRRHFVMVSYGKVKERAIRLACDACYVREEELTFGLGKTSVLRDPAIPTRLPAPRMVHSAMWLDTEDC